MSLGKNMKRSARNAVGILGIAILGCVLVAVTLYSSPDRSGGLGMDSGPGPNHKNTDRAPVQSRDEGASSIQSDPTWKTKSSNERPSAAELAKKRREMHRIDLVEKLAQYKAAGLGEKHPTRIQAEEELKKIEAEQAAAPDVR